MLTVLFFFCSFVNDRCIGRWLAERSATCPLCKTELYDEDEESSSSEEDAAPAAGNGETTISPDERSRSNWRQLLSMLNFGLEGGSENLVTVTQNRSPSQEETGSGEESSPEPSWWRRLLLRSRNRRRRTFAEQHGVTLNALAEPLLQAENGEVENVAGTAETEAANPEPRPDPPEGGSPGPE